MEEKARWLGLSGGYCLLYGRENKQEVGLSWNIDTPNPRTHMHHSAQQSTASYTFHNLLEEYCQPETQGSNTCLWGIFHMQTTEVDGLRSSHMVSTLLLTTMPTSTRLVLQFLHRQLTCTTFGVCLLCPFLFLLRGKAIRWPALVMHQD